MLKKTAIFIGLTFSSETETGDFVPPYTDLLSSFGHGFHFLTLMF